MGRSHFLPIIVFKYLYLYIVNNEMTTRKTISESRLHRIIMESVNRLLNEGISDTTFHYCSMEALYGILEDGCIGMSMSSNRSDAVHRTKLFYLSTQRSKNNRMGYAGNGSRYNGIGYECRIELDGYELKKDGYEGTPIDYWGALQGKQTDIGPTASRVNQQYGNKPETDDDKRRRLKDQGKCSNFEFEDRIFSSQPELPLKYVRRIDCLIQNTTPFDKKLLELAQKRNVRLSFYSNERDFVMQTNNTLNNEIMNVTGEFQPEPKKWNEDILIRSLSRTVSRLCALLFRYEMFIHGAYAPDLGEKVLRTLKQFGLERFYDHVMEHIADNTNAQDLCIDMVETLRKLNTTQNIKTNLNRNVMLLGQHVLRKYGMNNFNSLMNYLDKKDLGKLPKPVTPTQETANCVMISYYEDWNDATIYDGEKRCFWDYYDKDQFYHEISRQADEDDWNKQYGTEPVIHYKSANMESFKKYLQHLTHNDNLPLYEGARVLCHVYNNDFNKMAEAFGRVVKPIHLDKDSFIQYENQNVISWGDMEGIRDRLFGNEDLYYEYRWPKQRQ